MTTFDSELDDDRLDQATARRLARLGTMPVELGRIRQAIEAEIGPPPAVAERRRSWRLGWPNRGLAWPTPLRAAAASLLLFGLIAAAVVLGLSGRPALASADRLAEIHAGVQQRDGLCPCPVQSIAEANSALSTHAPHAQKLPEVQADDVQFCCVQKLGRRPISCCAIVVDGQPVTLAVGDAKHVRVPPVEPRVVDGRRFYVQSHETVNMVMTQRDGQWVCAMGAVPPDRLVEVAKGLKP